MFLIPLPYYNLYLESSAGFLFDLDQGNVDRDIQYMEHIITSHIQIQKSLMERIYQNLKDIIESFSMITIPVDKKKTVNYSNYISGYNSFSLLLFLQSQ